MSEYITNQAIVHSNQTMEESNLVITDVHIPLQIIKRAITSASGITDTTGTTTDNHITYDITLVNHCSYPVSNIILYDTMTSDHQDFNSYLFVYDNNTSTYSNQTNQYNSIEIHPQQSIPAHSQIQFQYSVNLNPEIAANTNLINQASVDYDENPTHAPISSNIITITKKDDFISSCINVQLVKSGPEHIVCGQYFTYQISFFNLDDIVISDITITDKLPNNFIPDLYQIVVSHNNVVLDKSSYITTLLNHTLSITLSSTTEQTILYPQDQLIINIKGKHIADDCTQLTNQSMIDFNYGTNESLNHIQLNSNIINTLVSCPCVPVTSGYCIDCCCCNYVFWHYYSITNQNDFPIYDIILNRCIPNEFCSYDVIYINCCPLKPYLQDCYKVPIIKPGENIQISFCTEINCNCNIPSLLSTLDITYHFSLPDTNQMCNSIKQYLTNDCKEAL